jgi:hypothetical protein
MNASGFAQSYALLRGMKPKAPSVELKATDVATGTKPNALENGISRARCAVVRDPSHRMVKFLELPLIIITLRNLGQQRKPCSRTESVVMVGEPSAQFALG